MNRHLQLVSGTFTILLIIGTVLFSSKKDHSTRNTYDHFLARQYQHLRSGNTANNSKPADHPDLAAFQNYFMTIDPQLKRVPSERLSKAYAYTRQLKNKQAKSGNTLEWDETGSNMGGRTRALLWDPNDATGKKVWAGSVTGGLWYTNDIYNADSLWHVVNDFWPGLSISSLFADPSEPMTIYAGTGEYQTAREIYRESSGIGLGIWKSTDGGESWELLESTSEFKYISDLKIRDEGGNSVIYAGVVSGIYHNAIQTSEPSDGLYRSTNGGTSWEQVLPDITGEELPYAPADIELGPNGRIFVGTLKNLNGNGGSTILYSDEGTMGSWTVFDDYETIIQNDPIYPIPGRVTMACAPSDANRVYALVGAGHINSTGFNYAWGRYILKSNDGGNTWNPTNLPGGDPDWASLSWHAFAAAVNPGNPDDIFVGGLDVWKSSNGGNSWSHISDWSLMSGGGGDDYVHADQHQQLYKPGSTDEMILSTDGGVFYTANASSNNPVFEQKNQGMGSLQFYTCDIYPTAGQNYFIGGLQDNGSLLYMGQPLTNYDMVDGADGAYCFIDQNEPQIMITSYYYNSYSVFMNWNYYTWMGNYGTGVFINPADYDNANNILYANGVTFSGANANQLLRIKNIPNNPNDQLVNINTGIDTYFSNVKVSPFGAEGTSTLFVGSQNGRLFKVSNAQSNPESEEIGSEDFPTAYISCIAIGGSEDTLLLTFSNYGIPSVWQSYDGGSSWADISGNLPDMPIRWALYHPQNSKQVMLATEVGIWTSNDASAGNVSWEPDAGFPNVRVDMLQVRSSDNMVLAASHGRGMLYQIWNYSPANAVHESQPMSFSISPNPASNQILISSPAVSQSTVDILNAKGQEIYHGLFTGQSRIDVSGFETGVYFIRIKGTGEIGVQKLVIQ